MDTVPAFAAVVAFGKALNFGEHEFPLSTNGRCPPALADWTLIIDYGRNGTVKVRGKEPLSLAERTVFNKPLRIRWSSGSVAVVFEMSGQNGTLALRVSFKELANEPSDGEPTVDAYG